MDSYGGSYGPDTADNSDSTNTAAANEDDDDDDFYGFKTELDEQDTKAAASKATAKRVKQQEQTTTQSPGNSSPATGSMRSGEASALQQKKVDNQTKTAELRAKLLAKKNQRVASPAATATQVNTSSSIPATPFKNTGSLTALPEESKPASVPPQGALAGMSKVGDVAFTSDNVDHLIAAAQADATAKAKAKATSSATTAVSQGDQQNMVPPATSPPRSAPRPVTSQDQLGEQTLAPNSTHAQSPKQQVNGATTISLHDPYFDDLPLWLELTGFHDLEYRSSKLRASKQRRQEMEDLEKEAARIADKLKTLREAENTDLESMRHSVAPSPAQAMPPPRLPSTMMVTHPMNTSTNTGTKRSITPDANRPAKVSRIETHESLDNQSGYRIHGTNDSDRHSDVDHFEHSTRKSTSPFRLDRTAASPGRNPRHTSIGGRQTQTERIYPSQEPGPRQGALNTRGAHRGGRRETYSGNMREEQWGRHMQSYASLPSSSTYRPHGIRYFIIKSWNQDNVLTAQRDSLWATQEKNEGFLREAYETSSAVILLFSVNKSMAFQGYAQMTSPPNPSLPKPTFCRKLNWKTSPAFTLRWYATYPVHFRMVGHLKNELNLDENGHPMAVLIGKDGQEVAEDAGRGVCEILDDADHDMGR